MNWIKVTDELPSEDEVVLAWHGDGWNQAIYKRCWHKGVLTFSCDDDPLYELSCVTHWARVEKPE